MRRAGLSNIYCIFIESQGISNRILWTNEIRKERGYVANLKYWGCWSMRFVENLKHPDSRSKIIAVLATLIDGLECPDSMVHVPHFGRWCRVKLRQSIDTIVEQQLREIFLFLLLLHIRGDPRCWRGCTRRRRGGSTIHPVASGSKISLFYGTPI